MIEHDSRFTKNSFLIPRLLGWLLDLAEELPDSLYGFRIFISIDFYDIDLGLKKHSSVQGTHIM